MRRARQQGQALIEFALILPLLFLLILNVVNFGALFSAIITVTHASRSGAQYTVQGPLYLGSGSANGLAAAPTPAQVIDLLTLCRDGKNNPLPGDMCSLPNLANATISVCSNNAATGTPEAQFPQSCLPPTDPETGAVFTDPEPDTSVIASVEVRYRYCPLIAFWEFPALGIHLTLPACSSDGSSGGVLLRRVAVMRIVQ